MPTSLTTTYLVPAILLNPCVILHFFNTAVSHIGPGHGGFSSSPNRWLERLGPEATSEPYFDVHSNEQLCWGYTILMVLVQLLAFGKVSDNRIRRRAARAAKKERERLRRTSVDTSSERSDNFNRHDDTNGYDRITEALATNGVAGKINGHRATESAILSTMNGKIAGNDEHDISQDSEATSEEETIV